MRGQSHFSDYIELFEQIENTSKRAVKGKQLACISRLVFHCGVRRHQVPELKIGDVMDTTGNIIRSIQKFDKEINLTDEMAAEIQNYLNDLKKQNPTLTNQSDWLFPDYRSEKKLERHWDEFGTKYIDIFHAGIKNYYSDARKAGKDEKNIFADGSRQLRISEREFEAVAYDKKIPAGKTIDETCIETIIRLLDQAERMKKSDPNSKQKATDILNEFEETVKKFKSKKSREKYEAFRPRFHDLLNPYIQP